MQTVLKEKLWAFIVHNNPELMLSLQADFSVTGYLEEKVASVVPLVERLLTEGKPQYIIEELCLNDMTAELRPSKFLYIRSILEEEFPNDHEQMREAGILTFEVINMIEHCKEIFDSFNFSTENEEDRHLKYAIIGQLHDYLPY